jgi:hypothetical protein
MGRGLIFYDSISHAMSSFDSTWLCEKRPFPEQTVMSLGRDLKGATYPPNNYHPKEDVWR